ncbi:MAG: hypothetical protein QOH51_3197 [Acidobacteriota bacterium]|jgi:hypothetical protein|nr:hypothetical protein [Acidobacteriota bacterium]
MADAEETIKSLESLVGQIESLKQSNGSSIEFKKWRHDTERLLRNTFGESSHYFKEFTQINFGLYSAIGPTDMRRRRELYSHGLDDAQILLQSIIEDSQVTNNDNLNAPNARVEGVQVPAFPNITPSKIRGSKLHAFENDDLKSEEDYQQLVLLMFRHPEREFYLYEEKDGDRNELLLAMEEIGEILFVESEFFFYRRPNSKAKGDFIHLERRGGQFEYEWEKEIVEKEPMFIRTTLSLSNQKRRELETWQKVQLEDAFRKQLRELECNNDVFISYSSGDKQEAIQLYDAIVAAGGKAFLSEKSLKPGVDFADEIRAALSASKELWLLVTPNSIKSDWVLSEWGAAWALQKKIVPILHRCSPESLPDRLKRLHCIDFYKYPDLIKITFSREQR